MIVGTFVGIGRYRKLKFLNWRSDGNLRGRSNELLYPVYSSKKFWKRREYSSVYSKTNVLFPGKNLDTPLGIV